MITVLICVSTGVGYVVGGVDGAAVGALVGTLAVVTVMPWGGD